MEDVQIIDLYWLRDERAIGETDAKYGSFCHRIAMNILHSFQDSEECVSDAYGRCWDTMPPQRPESLRAYLGGDTAQSVHQPLPGRPRPEAVRRCGGAAQRAGRLRALAGQRPAERRGGGAG